MKTLNNIVLVSVIMLLFVENYTQAQSTSFICGTDKAAFEALIESADVTNCSKNSQAYMNKYQLQTHYIPNSSSYEAVKTIPINIVVFLEDDATIFPFQVSGSNASYYDKNGNQTAGFSTTTSDVQHHEDWMNRAYDQTQPPNGIGWQVPSNNQVNTMPQNVSYLSDSKIRFVIKHYYFYENSVLYNGNSYANDDNKLVYHLNKNPETINHLNCILAKNIGHPTAGGYADIYEHNGKKAISVQSLCLNYTLFCDDFYTQNHLSHEFGHHLRFWHTYDYTETHDTTNIDYLDDVFPYPPFRFIGDNVLGGSEPNDFISPKQMGRAHRTLALDLSRHFAYGYSTTPHEITSDELWDFAFKSYNDIVIKNGATLTINCRLEMVPEAKIIVEKGGKLIIDGATITSARCGGPEYEGLWKGIYLEGDYSEIQIPANKGYVELKNGAVIENAEVGITTMPLTFSGVGKILGTGGIIQAEDATFRNCQYGIRMYPYQNYNYSGKKIRDLSFMKNSIFETTDDLIEPAIKPVCFIDLTEVYNVDIVGNTFRNINPNCTNANDRGNGIFSMDAKITINHICSSPTAPPPCTTFNTNKFEGLKYGIYAMATQANIPLSIKNSEFENNCYGVYLSGISSATVTSNKFNVILDNTMLKTAYGLYLDNCTGYTVEENEFDKVTGTGTYQNVGMVINNSGSDKNQIYNNTFENITHGMLAQHDNRGNTDKTGLKIKCNDFTSVSNTDLGITKKGSYSGVFGIANHQGADAGVSSPAGNTFSWAGVNIYSDINNAGENISKYYHHEIQLATPSAGENWVPVYFDATKVSLDEAELLYYTKAEACPSNIIGGGLSISQLYDEVSIQSINVSSSELILDIWKDGGLEDLPEQIELAYPWETYVMYNTLISG
ncbi:MAG: hypothetical protein H8E98_01365, partial [Bacteroidetes bacterium]|nr:hypothetical protein [Bacteroidota bacterium]